MSYSPAPRALDRAKPAPWNVDPAFVDPKFRGLWRGLVLAVPAWDAAPTDVAGRRFPTAVDGTHTFTTSAYGVALDLDGSTGIEYATVLADNFSDRFTFLTFVYDRNGEDQFPPSKADGARGGTGGVDWELIGIGNGNVRWKVAPVGEGFETLDVSGQHSLNTWEVWAGVYVAGEHQTLYKDGFEVATTTPSGTALKDQFPWTLPAITGSFQFDGLLAAAYVWTRELSPAEIRLVSVDPFGMFRPNWDYVAEAGGTEVTNNATVATATSGGLDATVDAQVAVTNTAEVGTATAQGLDAAATGDVAITNSAEVGTATSQGLDATASGNVAVTHQATVGTATSTGLDATATADVAGLFAGEVGTAQSQGLDATATGNVAVTNTAEVGTATAQGLDATVDTADTGGFEATTATAQAQGLDATVTANVAVTHSATVGTATSQGLDAEVFSGTSVTFEATTGTADSVGLDGSLNVEIVFQASTGQASSQGLDAVLSAGFQVDWTATTATAQAEGVDGVVGDQPFSPTVIETVYARQTVEGSYARQTVAGKYIRETVEGNI